MSFVSQVCEYGAIPYCLESNNICLIVLPCPGTVGLLAIDCMYSVTMLLLVADDAKPNPRGSQDVLQQIVRNPKEIKKTEHSAAEYFSSIRLRFTVIKASVEDLCNSTKKIESSESKLADLINTMAAMSKKVDDHENRRSRNKLILYGITENSNVTVMPVESNVCGNICSGTLGVHVSVECIHRLGKKRGSMT